MFFNELMQDVDITLEIQMFWNQCTHSWNKKSDSHLGRTVKKLEISKKAVVL